MKSKKSTSQALYRFAVLALLQVMGYSGMVRQHIHIFPYQEIRGDEAFAFGFACLSVAFFLIVLEYDLIRRRILKT